MGDIEVVVAWISPVTQELVNVSLPCDATVACAIAASGLVERYGLDIQANAVGINGRLVRLDSHVSDGDRVEIYRPLRADVKVQRRTRAALEPPSAGVHNKKS